MPTSVTHSITCQIPTLEEFTARFPRYGNFAANAGQFLFDLLMTPESFLAAEVATVELDRPAVAGVAKRIESAVRVTLDLIVEQTLALYKLLVDLEVRSSAPRRQSKGRKSAIRQSSPQDKLHAPSALGLIAKNVRNVAVLQPDHRPTTEEKRLALSLTEHARRLAITGRDAARHAFGPADDDCRVRAQAGPVRRIITHSEPDADAITAAWLVERFLWAGEAVEILFVPRQRALGAYRFGDCLVDVGNTHDPANFFFDHKPPALPSRHDSCAAKLVWAYLRTRNLAVDHLQPLIHAALAGDSVKLRARYSPEYRRSKTNGLHAVLDRADSTKAGDAVVYRAARWWLDRTFCSPRCVAGKLGQRFVPRFVTLLRAGAGRRAC